MTDEQLEATSSGGFFSYPTHKVKELFPKVYRAIDKAVYQSKQKDAIYDMTH